MGLDPFPKPADAGLQLLPRSAPFDRRTTFAVGFPPKLKPQEVKPLIVGLSVPAKAEQFGLVRGHFQSVEREPLLEGLLKSGGFMPILEADHKVVREAEQPALASIAFLPLLRKPLVQHIVQVNVGQYGGNNSPLGCPQRR